MKQYKKRDVKKRNTFLLQNINISEIDKKYGINVDSNIDSVVELPPPQNTTKIDELSSKQSYFFPFIDKSHKCCVTMIDCITSQKIKSVNCFWCKHPFSSNPIGCPIKYVNSNILQTHISEITKEKYTLQRQISRDDTLKLLSQKPNKNIKLIQKNYYETDGCFCSFNCCLSFINDNVHNILYINSNHLLMRMYMDTFSTNKIPTFHPAPSWRLLSDYGGFMSIDEFRNSFINCAYISKDMHINYIPKVLPIGHIFEEHYIF